MYLSLLIKASVIGKGSLDVDNARHFNQLYLQHMKNGIMKIRNVEALLKLGLSAAA